MIPADDTLIHEQTGAQPSSVGLTFTMLSSLKLVKPSFRGCSALVSSAGTSYQSRWLCQKPPSPNDDGGRREPHDAEPSSSKHVGDEKTEASHGSVGASPSSSPLGGVTHRTVITRPWWQNLIAGAILPVQNFMVTRYITNELETGFDAGTFLEAAKDAFWITMRLMQSRDWSALESMMSPKLLQQLKASYERQSEDQDLKGLDWRWIIPDDFPASLVDLKFWTPRKAEEFTGLPIMIPPNLEDLNPAKTHNMGPPPGSYALITVAYDFTLKCEVFQKSDAKVVDEIMAQGPHLWRFLGGPLPENMPARQLDLQWTLVGVSSTPLGDKEASAERD